MLRDSDKVIAELKTPYGISGTQSEPMARKPAAAAEASREHNKDKDRNIALARKNLYEARKELARGWGGEHGIMGELERVYRKALEEQPPVPLAVPLPEPPRDSSEYTVFSYMKSLFDPCAEYAGYVLDAFKTMIRENKIKLLQKKVVLVAVLKHLPELPPEEALLPEYLRREILGMGRGREYCSELRPTVSAPSTLQTSGLEGLDESDPGQRPPKLHRTEVASGGPDDDDS